MKTRKSVIGKEEAEGFALGFLLLMFLMTGIGVCSGVAQSTVKGFEANYGFRAFQLNSNIKELDRLNVVTEGGNAGGVFGNEAIKVKVRALGFYYSIATVGRTINMFEMEGLVNFHPLKFGNWSNAVRVSPYIVGGATQDFIKFFGNYLNENEQQAVNYSDTSEPYLGKISVSSAVIGLGIEWRLGKDNYESRSFVHLFGEAKYGIPFSTTSTNDEFKNTRVQKYAAVNVGVCFGLFKEKK